MSKKILLVYPEIPTTYWSFSYALPFIGKKALLPPLGLITVASLLPEDYEVSLIDLNVGRGNRCCTQQPSRGQIVRVFLFAESGRTSQ